MSSFQLCTHPRSINTTTSIIKIPASQYYYKHTIKNNNNNNNNNINFNIKSSPALIRSRLAAASNDSVMSDHEKKISAFQLPEGLEEEMMPKHVAVIMDGHRRWAKNNMLTEEQGHRAGGKAIKELAKTCSNFGVKVLTIFAFSTENWIRPKEEVGFLMSFFHERGKEDLDEIMRNEFRVSVMGDKSKLPESLQSLIIFAEEYTKANKGMHIVLAVNYGGRYDITAASKKIATKVRDGVLQVEEISEAIFEQHLGTNGIEFPNPDLLIRTSGESRVSNFMLWQLAYSELYFSNKLFPDFGEDDFVEALRVFQKRHRRYGGGYYIKQM